MLHRYSFEVSMMARRNKQDKKDRIEWIEFQSSGQSSSVKMTIDPFKNSIKLHEVDYENLKLKRTYERLGKSEKVLLSINHHKDEIFFNPLDALKSQYQHLIAIDTNTINIENKIYGVTVAYAVPKELKFYENNEIPYIPLCAYVLVDIAEGVNPEKIGWNLVLTRNINPANFRSGNLLGIIVDSELGDHDRINSREIPYYENNILPDYANLIYASDATADSLPNQMIRHCDSTAKNIIKIINNPDCPPMNPCDGDKNYSGFLVINLNYKDDYQYNKI